MSMYRTFAYLTGNFRLLVMGVVLLAPLAMADEANLSADQLESTLSRMQRLQEQLAAAQSGDRPDLLFDLGIEADNLALSLTNEVVNNNMIQRNLIEQAMDRTSEMGIRLLWYPDKRRFIYEGEVYRLYLQEAPNGPQAGEVSYRLIEHEFFGGNSEDIAGLQQGVERKLAFLEKFSDNKRSPKVAMLLAIDSRDMWRYFRDNGNVSEAERYSDLTRERFQRVVEAYPGTEESQIATGLLARFETELTGPPETDPAEADE